ncbi:MAG: hypothetical protein NZ805_02125 [Armatimonadetes bacterium]|nr:hypothetical protein [Armatimonadota bacterium]MDW8026831.1 hypothetical protein [Armatimonadota bacterium]
MRDELQKQVQKSPLLEQLAFVWSMGLTLLSAIVVLMAMWFGTGISLGIERLTMRDKQYSVPDQKPIRFGAILLFASWLAAIVWLWEVGAIKWVWSTYKVAMDIAGLDIAKLGISPQSWQAFLLTLVAMLTLIFALVLGLFGKQKGIPMSRSLVQGIWRWSLPVAATIFMLYAFNLLITVIWEGRFYLPI